MIVAISEDHTSEQKMPANDKGLMRLIVRWLFLLSFYQRKGA